MTARNSEIFNVDHPLLAKHTGLTTREALSNLHCEVLKFKANICDKKKIRNSCRRIIYSSFHHSSYYSTFSWIPVCVLINIVLILVIFTTSSYSAIIILFLTLMNIVIVFWDNYLRLNEFGHRLNYVLKMLKKAKKKNNWHADLYPNLFTPNSPAVSLQWTIRDGRILNLPTVLLAKGDVIILRPGQLAPAHVETIYPAPSPHDKYNVLLADQLFAHEPSFGTAGIVHCDTHKSVEQPQMNDRLYTVLQAPYVAQLNALSQKYFERPVSLYDKARYLLFSKCLHHTLLPIFFILCELLAAIRWYIFTFVHCQNCSPYDKWTYFFITETSSLIIPLISLVFPLFWFVSNAFGNALLLSRYSCTENKMGFNTEKDVSKVDSSYFDDIEASFKSSGSNNENKRRRRNHLFRLFLNFAQSNKSAMVRYTNFLHTMASVTVLCCVDKKGVLSFPNPIAEKVFFMKNACPEQLSNKGEINWNGRHTVVSSTEDTSIAGNLRECSNDKSSKRITPAVEILDITPRNEKDSAWKIEFDDSQWRFHLPSLKPLGLAILVNTCNKPTHETYNDFCSFITGHAVQHKHLVPVANRRCLCELARQIGFYENYIEDKYGLELQLFTYKNLAETQTGNKYVKAIFKTRKPKFPFPHAMSVIVNNDVVRNGTHRFNNCLKKENDDVRRRKMSMNNREEKQMFSQGTADLILDFCVDYWDGYDVHPLTPSIRKKILDFYQRCSLTAYCTAFSYRPVHKNLRESNRRDLKPTVYLEFLKNIASEHVQRRQRRRYRKSRELKKFDKDMSFVSSLVGYKSHCKNERETTPLQQLPECDEEIDDNFGDNVEDYDEDVGCSIADCNNDIEFDYYSEESDEEDDDYADVELVGEGDPGSGHKGKYSPDAGNRRHHSKYVQILGKQIFLGMVSMQYQPLVDMVQLIEELEKACIRFVHFSKENELRSRVFSEKMGLESGWNCHISLLPDADSKS